MHGIFTWGGFDHAFANANQYNNFIDEQEL